MAKQKYDGVVEAVHYRSEGEIEWVRAFLRRGPTWSDRLMLDREALVKLLKSGKRFVVGKRITYMGTTFETSDPLNLIENKDCNVLVTGEVQSNTDHLDGVPII